MPRGRGRRRSKRQPWWRGWVLPAGLLVVLLVGYRRVDEAGAWGAVGAGVAAILTVAVLSGAAIVLRNSRRRLQRLRRLRTLRDLLDLSPGEFEEAVADVLRALGYDDVRRVGGAGDLAIDVWCRDGEGRRIAVQCKRYSPDHKVGSPEVQTFIGMIYQVHRAGRGYFVTTSGFTAPALALARGHDIVPIDGDRLLDWIERAKRSGGDGRIADRDATTAA